MEGTSLAFLVVVVTLVFVWSIVRMGIRHKENLERIRHGYPTIDGKTSTNVPDDYIARAKSEDANRLQ